MRQRLEIYGQWMIDELGLHGYPLGRGSRYPMLHVIERKGYLVSSVERQGRTARSLYRATKLGRDGLAVAKVRTRGFTGEAMKP